MTKQTVTDFDTTKMTTVEPTTPRQTPSEISGRHAKMFDLLRQGDLESTPAPAPRARACEATPRYADEDAIVPMDRPAPVAQRYLDPDTADQMIARGVSSFKVPGWLNQSSERATQRTATFLNRQPT